MEIPVSKPSYYVVQAMAKRLDLPPESIAAELVSTCIAIVGCDADYLNTDDLRGKIQDGLHDAGDSIREYYAELQYRHILKCIKESCRVSNSILTDFLERHDDETDA